MATHIGQLNRINSDSAFEFERSSLLILSPNVFDLYVAVLECFKRDFDILEETLGNVSFDK